MNTGTLIKAIGIMDALTRAEKDSLIKLDSEMGDGDLGIYMELGMRLGYEKCAAMENALPGEVLKALGMTFSLEAPSTMGTLIGTAFMQAGRALGDASELSPAALAGVYRSFCDGIIRRGHAKAGDKTILDSLIPAADAAQAAADRGADMREISLNALDAARRGVEEARGMKAVYGRPAYFGDATIGKYDGGSIMGRIICEALSKALD